VKGGEGKGGFQRQFKKKKKKGKKHQALGALRTFGRASEEKKGKKKKGIVGEAVEIGRKKREDPARGCPQSHILCTGKKRKVRGTGLISNKGEKKKVATLKRQFPPKKQRATKKGEKRKKKNTDWTRPVACLKGGRGESCLHRSLMIRFLTNHYLNSLQTFAEFKKKKKKGTPAVGEPCWPYVIRGKKDPLISFCS